MRSLKRVPNSLSFRPKWRTERPGEAARSTGRPEAERTGSEQIKCLNIKTGIAIDVSTEPVLSEVEGHDMTNSRLALRVTA